MRTADSEEGPNTVQASRPAKGADDSISVIIPSYDSAATISQTLESLANQRGVSDYEVIVVNSSDDATPEIVEQILPSATLVQLERQTPAGVARNLGARKATGKYLAFLDSDCTVGPDWLENMLKHFSHEFCALGGPIENANPDSLVSRAGHILEFSQFYSEKGMHVAEHIPSGNLFLLRTTFMESGGFPAELFPQEDRFHSWKLHRDTGKPLMFHPGIPVKHHHRTTLKGFLSHQSRIGYAGAAILRRTDLRGSRIVGRRLLANLLLPVFPMIKLTRSILRTLRWKPEEILLKPHVVPVLCLGMLWWMFGFARQVNLSTFQDGAP